jgi:hypothetical protein
MLDRAQTGDALAGEPAGEPARPPPRLLTAADRGI